MADAYIRMARCALALALHKKEKGKYPDLLDVLVSDYLPRMQMDPFDGKPIRYQLQDKGYVLYSIGRNRRDDGGSRGEYDNVLKKKVDADLVWVMEK